MAKKVALATLGCKVNQCESSYIQELLLNDGYNLVKFHEKADIYIVHGCTVTSRAAYETRQLVRRAHRSNPDAKSIVIMGCAAHSDGMELASKKLVTHVLGNKEKYNIVNILDEDATFERPFIGLSDPRKYSSIVPLQHSSMISDRSRAYLKIQDGCDAFCSYCIVPFVRGKSRSLPPKSVSFQLQHLLDASFQEVVLTGIHIGKWGNDLKPKQNLLSLLKFLETNSSMPPRLRLSSLEPTECDLELIAYLSNKSWFCNHFHIPLQSGDDRVLKRMNRDYNSGIYEDIIWSIRKAFPDAAIGADVIVGFPEETEDEFKNTYNLIKKLPLTYLHVFPYSPRKWTRCYSYNGVPSKLIRKERASLLRSLGNEKKLLFLENHIGKSVEIILEVNLGTNIWKGTSRNYITVVTELPYSSEGIKGMRALVKITKVDKKRLQAYAKFLNFIP